MKLVSLGFGAALVSLAAMSNAGPNPNLTGFAPEAPQVVENEFLSFKVQGTGTCRFAVKDIDPTGKERPEDNWFTKYPQKLPTGLNRRPNMPGQWKTILTTVADPQTPGCAPGQTMTVSWTAFKEPRCPNGWDRTYFNKNTGQISCTPLNPHATCAGKTEPFFDSANNVCQAGCQTVVN